MSGSFVWQGHLPLYLSPNPSGGASKASVSIPPSWGPWPVAGNLVAAGDYIRGSPFCVVGKSTVEKLGTPLLTLGGVKAPCGVAINKRGEVVVTEGDGHCVSVYSPSGERIQQFGRRGSGRGEFDRPDGVAVDGEGNVLVVDRGNHRIQKFTAEGRFLAAVDTKGLGRVSSDDPCYIAYNKE